MSLIDHRLPKFFTCVNSVPLPPTAPAGARDVVDMRRSACGLGSGYPLIVRISDGQGTVPAGKNVVQTVDLQGSHGQPHTLPPGSLHIFSDGQYAGSRDLRLPTP